MTDRSTHPASSIARVTLACAIGFTLLTSGCSDATLPSAPDVRPALAANGNAYGRGECLPDSKLIGRIAVSTADAPNTWWRLTREGLDAAGMEDYQAAIEGFFGMTFPSLDAAVVELVSRVELRDVNDNGFVCAYELRGTRTSLDDPNYALYTFAVLDDR